VSAPTEDPHVHQEIFEVLGHTLYESVHVFLVPAAPGRPDALPSTEAPAVRAAVVA
jgi:hypothetical protein